MKTNKGRFLLVVVVLFLLAGLPVAVFSDDWFPAGMIGADTDTVESAAIIQQPVSVRETALKILELRKKLQYEELARVFVGFFSIQRSTRDILDLLEEISIPLPQNEIEAIGSVLINMDDDERFYTGMNYGYTLEVHATPGTRLSLIFLDRKEVELYRKWGSDESRSLTPHEKQLAGNLEGRLCVWPKSRRN
jgi:hypothetical protein